MTNRILDIFEGGVIGVYLSLMFAWVDFSSREANLYFFGGGCLMLSMAIRHISMQRHLFRFIEVIELKKSPITFWTVSIIECVVSVWLLSLFFTWA